MPAVSKTNGSITSYRGTKNFLFLVSSSLERGYADELAGHILEYQLPGACFLVLLRTTILIHLLFTANRVIFFLTLWW